MKTLKRLSFLTAIFALFLTFSANSAFAQVKQNQRQQNQPEMKTLKGTVVDGQTGEAVSNAEVSVAEMEDLDTTTNRDGKFEIDNLAPGTYTIKVEMDGYKDWEQKVEVNKDKDITVKLEPSM